MHRACLSVFFGTLVFVLAASSVAQEAAEKPAEPVADKAPTEDTKAAEEAPVEENDKVASTEPATAPSEDPVSVPEDAAAESETPAAPEAEAPKSDETVGTEAPPTSETPVTPEKTAEETAPKAESTPVKPEEPSTEEAATAEAPTETSTDKSLTLSSGKKQRMFTAGIGVPLAGFAYEGLIEGKGWANTSSNFLWGNLDLRFHVRLTEKFSVGGGLIQSFLYFDGVGLMGGHLVADFRWYAVPDYLYFKIDLIFGFPMLFAMGPAMGHSFSVTKTVHIFIENQFIFMAVAGVYGFWQPTIGVSTRF